MSILHFSDEEILAEAHKLRVGYGLKRTIRYGAMRDVAVHTESVAEHVFALLYLAQYFLEHEVLSEPVDRLSLYTMLIFHDFGEIVHGDIPYHLKTVADQEKEIVAAQEVFASLPQPLARVAKENWEVYEKKETPEARFAHALDKMEPMFELLDPINERSVVRLGFTYEKHIGKKFAATEGFPVMRRFVEVLCRDMLQRGVFGEEARVAHSAKA